MFFFKISVISVITKKTALVKRQHLLVCISNTNRLQVTGNKRRFAKTLNLRQVCCCAAIERTKLKFFLAEQNVLCQGIDVHVLLKSLLFSFVCSI